MQYLLNIENYNSKFKNNTVQHKCLSNYLSVGIINYKLKNNVK